MGWSFSPLLTGAAALNTAPAANTELRVAFATPYGALASGDVQQFRVLARKTDVANPTLSVFLYEDGAEVAELVTDEAITSDVGQVVTATWNVTSLLDSTGADVECYILGTSNGASQVEIGAVVWDVETNVLQFEGVSSSEVWFEGGRVTQLHFNGQRIY